MYKKKKSKLYRNIKKWSNIKLLKLKLKLKLKIYKKNNFINTVQIIYNKNTKLKEKAKWKYKKDNSKY